MPPPRQDKIVERVYGHYKILGYYGTRAVRSIIKNVLEFVVKRSRNMCAMTGLNILSLALWGEGARRTSEGGVGSQSNVSQEIDCHPELVSGSHKMLQNRRQSDFLKMLKQGQHDENDFLKRTYIKNITLTLSRKGRQKFTSHFTLHSSLKKQAAFTLAEVLITLGIIGIVAALTMPALIQNHKKSEASARLKKFYSTMQQAILLSENDNGSAKQWTKAGYIGKDPDTGLYDDADAVNTEIYFNTYLKNYLKYLKTEKDEDTNLFKVMMNDGSSFLMRNGNCIDFIFDYNGDKYPNKEGRDRYRFVICPAGYQFNTNKNLSFSVYAQAASTTRTQRLSNCKSDPRYCVGLLEYDNWEFKSDYPYRL